MVREIVAVLKTWEGSQTGPATAREIIEVFEKNGVMPQRYISSGCMCSVRDNCNCQGTYEAGWDPE